MDQMQEKLMAFGGVGAVLAGLTLLLLLFIVSRSLRSTDSRPPRVSTGATRTAGLSRQEQHVFDVASRLEADNRNLNQLLTMLPDFIKRLNGDLEKRNIGPLLMNFIDYLFEPRQLVMFYKSQHSDDLVLAQRKGVGSDINIGMRVKMGAGRIGWVAERQISLTRSEFSSRMILPTSERLSLKRFEESIEICAPMVHDNRTLGVVAIADLGRRPPNEKGMLRMVADLGSITLNTAALLRKAQLAANSDGLTGLFNKRYLSEQLEREIAKSEESGEPLSIFFFDFDHFKNYNDVNGHQAGDEALRICGRMLTSETREDDIPARYGGEEFVVVLPNTTKLGAYEAGEKLRAAIESYDYPHGEKQPLGRVTISGGVATFPEDGRNVSQLLEAADSALYRAKKQGRNRVIMHEVGFEATTITTR